MEMTWLADRIANVEASMKDSPNRLAMYRVEYPEFRAALHRPDPVAEPLWRHLDALLDGDSL